MVCCFGADGKTVFVASTGKLCWKLCCANVNVMYVCGCCGRRENVCGMEWPRSGDDEGAGNQTHSLSMTSALTKTSPCGGRHQARSGREIRRPQRTWPPRPRGRRRKSAAWHELVDTMLGPTGRPAVHDTSQWNPWWRREFLGARSKIWVYCQVGIRRTNASYPIQCRAVATLVSHS